MKKQTVFLFLLLSLVNLGITQPKTFNSGTYYERAENESPFPDKIDCVCQPVYRLRADGKPGREITVGFNGEKLYGKARLTVNTEGITEIIDILPDADGLSSYSALLPNSIGVKNETTVSLKIQQGLNILEQTIKVPEMRYWTIYLYNHSHVDIGYSNTHKNVEILQKTNIIEGIKLAEATKDYPAGSRFRWNPEITWPLERLWHTSSSEQKESIKNAVKKGQLCVDASYLHLNTSFCSDEELFQLFNFSRTMQEQTGVSMNTFQQIDIPGMTWGMVPVMAQSGIRYIMSWPNNVRAGNAHIGIDGLPFWWVGPDGKSKVLFFQPGVYANSGSMEKGKLTGRPWFGQRDPDKIPSFIKTGSANVNFTDKLIDLESSKYKYDFLVLSWSLWDNSPLDADIPDAVKAWNEQFVYPRIIISGAQEIMKSIEDNYGDILPVVSGDFTEYWTDGLGSAAGLTSINRNAKEKLVQSETLNTMLRYGKPTPRGDFDEAWRYIMLGTEHTWGTENPMEPFFQDAIWKVKKSYFYEAENRAQVMFEEALAPATDKSAGALGPIEGPANGGVAVFNTHSWVRGGVITLSKAESLRGSRVVDDNGKDVIAQRLSTGELVFLASEIPALGSRHYRVLEGNSPITKGCKLNGTELENEQLRVQIDPVTGNIAQLKNLNSNRNFVDVNVNGGINAFRWMPGDSDNAQADSGIVVSTVENGPLLVELRISSVAKGCRAVTRNVRLVYGQPWIEISNVVDKLPLIEKDGVHFGFGFDIPGGITHVDIPWGVMELEKDQLAAGNRNWLALQRWLDISNDKDGITWCSLDAPLFESGAMTANLTGDWSTERKPWLKKLELSSTVYSWAMNNHWFTNFQLTQDGPVTFRYRILVHGAYNAVVANRFGMEQTQPLVHVATNQNPLINPLVAIDNDRVYATILKSSADGKATILRLRSLSSKSEMVNLSFPGGNPKSVGICQVDETYGVPVSGAIVMQPFGLSTVRIEFQRK